MRTWRCCAVAVLLSATASAKDGGFVIALLEASNAFVGEERFGEPDLESFLAHYDALGETNVLGDRFFEDGRFRFDFVLEDKRFLAWAKERRLDPKPWLRKTMRIWTLGTHGMLQEIVAHDERLLERDRKSLEERRASLGEKEYEREKADLEELAAFTKRLRDAVKAVPAMSEEEAALWKKHAKDLDRVFGEGEEKGRGEEEGN